MSEVRGKHFEIFTTGSPSGAREALVALEQAHAYFVAVKLVRTENEMPLRVIAFHSTEEYAAFRLHQNAFGHFFRSADRSFIVLTDLLPEHREALLHEYTHAVVRAAGFALPQWLNEGVADLYSSLSVMDGYAFAGLPVQGRLRTLNLHGLLPLMSLFSSGTLAGNGRDAALLYAESWALTHMLCFHPDYSANFPRLLASASKNMDTAAVLERVFGKPLWQVENDLTIYLTRLSSAGGVNTPLSIQTSTSLIRSLNGVEGDAVLVALLQEQPWTRNIHSTD